MSQSEEGAANEAKQEAEGEDEEEGRIRCVCDDDNPADKRVFISCDTCEVWQHNICMGMPDDQGGDDIPEHYYCEQCAPEMHGETLQAIKNGDRIWETRNKIAANEKKAGRRRTKDKAKPGWLKKEVSSNPTQESEGSATGGATAEGLEETGTKRKREEVQPDPEPVEETPAEGTKASGPRQEKRRKSSVVRDSVTEIVHIGQLPPDRQKPALALSKIIEQDVTQRSNAGTYTTAEGETSKQVAQKYAALIEYELTMNYGDTRSAKYTGQFRMLLANFKKNKSLIERLLRGSLTPADVATMSSQEMASEELQRERAVMKEQLDRQAIAVQDDGPRYKRTHKGEELIEDASRSASVPDAPPQSTREKKSPTEGEGAGSPLNTNPELVGTARPPDLGIKVGARRQSSTSLAQRPSSRQQFDMSTIWARTAQSPTSAPAPRPMQMPPRRRSSIKPETQRPDGIKDDADVDRMLQDDDEPYSPSMELADPSIVWRGKIIQTVDDAEPVVNARFVAGRDITTVLSWKSLIPASLTIDGRLQVSKAEDYLISLQYSQTSDVAVLALTPQDKDQLSAFNHVFEYFASRGRYAVVNHSKPAVVKDLYIIPVEAGQGPPMHATLLEHSTLSQQASERLLLATFVIARAPSNSPTHQAQDSTPVPLPQRASNPTPILQDHGHGQLQSQLSPALRAPGPASSPLAPIGPGFASTVPPAGASVPLQPHQLPTNQYTTPLQHPSPPQPYVNPLVAEILGPLQYVTTAQKIVGADPNIARDKLLHLRHIMEEDPSTRTDLDALWRKLSQ